jgi:hypothetical protein
MSVTCSLNLKFKTKIQNARRSMGYSKGAAGIPYRPLQPLFHRQERHYGDGDGDGDDDGELDY